MLSVILAIGKKIVVQIFSRKGKRVGDESNEAQGSSIELHVILEGNTISTELVYKSRESRYRCADKALHAWHFLRGRATLGDRYTSGRHSKSINIVQRRMVLE